jgi:hypothetical protein
VRTRHAKKTDHKISRNLNVGDCRWNRAEWNTPDRITRVLRVTEGQNKMLYLRPIKKEEYSRSRKKIFTQHNLEDMKSWARKRRLRRQ